MTSPILATVIPRLDFVLTAEHLGTSTSATGSPKGFPWHIFVTTRRIAAKAGSSPGATGFGGRLFNP